MFLFFIFSSCAFPSFWFHVPCSHFWFSCSMFSFLICHVPCFYFFMFPCFNFPCLMLLFSCSHGVMLHAFIFRVSCFLVSFFMLSFYMFHVPCHISYFHFSCFHFSVFVLHVFIFHLSCVQLDLPSDGSLTAESPPVVWELTLQNCAGLPTERGQLLGPQRPERTYRHNFRLLVSWAYFCVRGFALQMFINYTVAFGQLETDTVGNFSLRSRQQPPRLAETSHRWVSSRGVRGRGECRVPGAEWIGALNMK